MIVMIKISKYPEILLQQDNKFKLWATIENRTENELNISIGYFTDVIFIQKSGIKAMWYGNERREMQ